MDTIFQHDGGTWDLPVGCFSVIVRHDAVITNFPGGAREFERVHKPVRRSWVLYLLTALTDERLAHVLAELEKSGLVPGIDVAVANRLRQPMLECLGVAFSDHGDHRWTVEIATGPDDLWGGDDPDENIQHTAVTGLTRKIDRRQFISDLGGALHDARLYKALTIREDDSSTSIDIVGTDLSALVTIAHRRQAEVPLVHWFDASRELRMVPKAWSSVNCFHHRKSNSFPQDLNSLIDCLIVGLTAARDGTAFQPEVSQ